MWDEAGKLGAGRNEQHQEHEHGVRHEGGPRSVPCAVGTPRKECCTHGDPDDAQDGGGVPSQQLDTALQSLKEAVGRIAEFLQDVRPCELVELKDVEECIRSVNLRPGPEPIDVVAWRLDGDARDLAMEGKLLSLLGIGRQAAQRRLVFPQRLALQARLRVPQVAVAVELAQVFARVQALDALKDTGGTFDLLAYKDAGAVVAPRRQSSCPPYAGP